MSNTDFTHDDQSKAETFDETHMDDEGEGDLLLDEAGGVPDLTHDAVDDGNDSVGDGDDDPDPGDPQANRGSTPAQHPGGPPPPPGRDEIEPVYKGHLDDVGGSQASAAHWEARTLPDDDIEALGYGPEKGPGAPVPACARKARAMTSQIRRDQDPQTPHARPADPVKDKADQLDHHEGEGQDRQEALVDEGLEETFPASDPVSVKRIT